MTSFGVTINCMEKSVMFGNPKKKMESNFLTASQVEASVADEAQLFMMFASLKVDKEKGSSELHVVNEFLDVFPDDVADLSLEREVDFSIDFVPGTSPVSMAPSRMPSSA